MSVAGGGWRVRSSLVVLLVFAVVQILVCCDCKAGAIRVFPGDTNAISKVEVQSTSMVKKGGMTREALFDKYFSGINRASNLNKTGKVYEESKRRVPSCPDQLHN